ncbi:MAG: MFS transporter [Rhodospirillaceae bacterium]|nr:MFS transporter [Rhodospirillaceae bacterium]
MTQSPTHNSWRHSWRLAAGAAAALLLITIGVRQTTGLFVAPIDKSTGLGIAAISFALAIGQFSWGAIQPIAGAMADRYGPGRVMAVGLIALSLGSALTSFMDSTLGLVVALGIMSAAGSGAAGFSVIMGALSHRVPAEKRGLAAGISNAGGSFGQFVFAPILQTIIGAAGWAAAMWFSAAAALAAVPFAWMLRKPANAVAHAVTQGPSNLSAAIKEAFGDRSYILVHAGFFTCGFHIAFLVTHLPGEIALCGMSPSVASWSLAIIGLANVVGSLIAGWATGSYRSKHVLFLMYASRAVLIGLYLLAPKTEVTFYLFAAGLGATWLATVAPTATIVGKLFGTRYLATLFGLTLLSHQVGAFFGAWLGGLTFASTGNYQWMWYVDAILAAAAAFVNLPIKEPAPLKAQTA